MATTGQSNPTTRITNQSQSQSQSQRPSDQEIIRTVRTLRDEIQAIASKAAQLERDADEHGVVVDTLNKSEPDRKCFRMIGGVLVERTVKETLPDLIEHKSNIEQLLKSFANQFQNKNKELVDYQAKWNIKVTTASP